MSSQNKVICVQIGPNRETQTTRKLRHQWSEWDKLNYDLELFQQSLLNNPDEKFHVSAWHDFITRGKKKVDESREQVENSQAVHEPGDAEAGLRRRYYDDIHAFREVFEKAASAWMKFMEHKEEREQEEETQHPTTDPEDQQQDPSDDGGLEEAKENATQGKIPVVYYIISAGHGVN